MNKLSLWLAAFARGQLQRQCLIETLLLIPILLLAAYLRLVRVTDNPGWYTDEGTQLEIAQNLTEGRIQYFVFNQSLLISARQPLFELLLAGTIRVFGSGMGTLRVLTGTLGVISVALLYGYVRRVQEDRLLPLLAALITATYPMTVLYTRFGFSYALLTPFVLLTALGLAEYWRAGSRKWLLLAAGSIGIGLTTDLMIGSLVAVLVVMVLFRRPRDLWWSLPVIAAPFGLYTAIMLLSAPDAFLFDLGLILRRLDGRPLSQQASLLAHNYTILLSQDFWMPLGLTGLFLLRSARLRLVSLLSLLLPILILGRTVALYSLSFYYVTPLLPFITLGVASFIRESVPYVGRMINQALADKPVIHGQRPLNPYIAGAITAMVIFLPLLVAFTMTLDNVRARYPTAIDPFLLSAGDVRSAVGYVNERVESADLVITSPGVGWLVDANVADYQMAVIGDGQGTVDFPSDIPTDRFAFDPGYRGAKFAIVDNLWRNWAAFHMPSVARMLVDIEQNWSLVFQSGALEVYQNPHPAP